MRLKPMADKIIVKPDVRELSSIIIVNNQEVENMGEVIAVGPGKKLPNGRREAMPIEVGDRIRFGTMNDDKGEEYLKYFKYEENGQKYLVMSWQDVCFIQEEKNGN
jgi:chaperonin GroES